jgi:hypothetical protein
MQILLTYITFLFLTTGCQSSGNTRKLTVDTIAKRTIPKKDTLVPMLPKVYNELIYEKAELLSAASGTKSVLFNSTGSLNMKKRKCCLQPGELSLLFSILPDQNCMP